MTPLAIECRRIVLRAQAALGKELCGYSMVDLVADQLADRQGGISLADIRQALVEADVGYQPKWVSR